MCIIFSKSFEGDKNEKTPDIIVVPCWKLSWKTVGEKSPKDEKQQEKEEKNVKNQMNCSFI